jgi:hypothetical protein
MEGQVATDAQDAMQFVDAAQQRAKGEVGLAWLAIALYTGFAVAAVSLGAVMGQGKFLWIVTAPFVALAAFVWAFFDGRERGVEASRLVLIAIPFGLLTVAFSLGALGLYAQLPLLAQFGPPMVMAVGYVAIGGQRRQPVMVLVGITSLLVTMAFALLNGGDELLQAILALAYVIALLAARIGWRLVHAKRA